MNVGIPSFISCTPPETKKSFLYKSYSSAAVYVVFAGNFAAFEHALLVVTGEQNFQWMKWCNKYTRFCFQIGGSLLCGCVASLIMVFIASISAFNLFRLYSPKKFLLLKAT
ncbi:hypothetical protein SCA6_011239 [Theobroma cacao]